MNTVSIRNPNKLIYDDIGKKIYGNIIPDTYLLQFTNDFSCDGKIKVVNGIDEINQTCATYFFQLLNSYNIPTFYLMNKSKTEIIIQKFDRIPIRLKILNFADRTIAKLFKAKVNEKLNSPIFEVYLNHSLKNVINEYHLLAFGIASLDETRLMIRIASKVNAILKSYFSRRDYDLAGAILEFGKTNDRVVLTSTLGFPNISLISKKNNLSFEIPSNNSNKIKEAFLNFQKLIY